MFPFDDVIMVIWQEEGKGSWHWLLWYVCDVYISWSTEFLCTTVLLELSPEQLESLITSIKLDRDGKTYQEGNWSKKSSKKSYWSFVNKELFFNWFMRCPSVSGCFVCAFNSSPPGQNGCHFHRRYFRMHFRQRLNFHRSLFLRVQLTPTQHWFR